MSRYHARMQTKAWQITRALVFKRDGYRCRRCSRPDRRECDHIVPLWQDPGQDPFDIDGCQTLCVDCHHAKTRNEARKRADKDKPQQPAWDALVNEV